MMREFYGLGGTKNLCPGTGSVISLKERNKVFVELEDKTEYTDEELTPFRYNKSTVKAWKLFVNKMIRKKHIDEFHYSIFLILCIKYILIIRYIRFLVLNSM